MKKILVSFVIFLFFCQSASYAVYVDGQTEYVWSEKTVQTAAADENTKDFMNLSCESAILIEQTTRKCAI